MPVNIIVTNAGRAAIVNAQHNGTAPVTITQVGLSGTALVPVATATALDGEFKRVSALSGEVVAADTIHLNMTDETNAVYSMRSFGLYLSDGTLFAIYGQPDPIINKTATSIGALTVDIIFADISAAALTFGNANFTNPPATTERQGVVELATVAEAKGGSDTLRAVTPAAAKQSVVDWIGYQPVNRAGDIVTSMAFGDGNFSAFRDGGGNPFLHFDTNDSLAFDRVGNSYHFFIGNVARTSISWDGWVTAQSGFRAGGSLVWNAGNDGAGSGLDADLLDGRQASDFALLDGSLSFGGSIKAQATNALLMRPAAGNYSTVIHRTDGLNYYVLMSGASAGFNETWNDLRPFQINLASGRVQSTNGQDFYGGTAVRHSLTLDGAGVWTSANDGAGSGLDADLLDGQDSTYYTNILARLGFTPVRQGGGIGQTSASANIVSIGWSNDARLKATVDALNLGNFVFDANLSSGTLGINGAYVARNGNHLFGPDNDGSGSGLDADLLDGRQGSDYALLDGSTTFTGSIRATAGNALLMKGAAGSVPTLIHRTDGSTYYMLVSAPNAAISDQWNALRPFSFSLTTGRMTSSNGQDFSGGTAIFGALTLDGANVWSSGNDGSGSGLDADLLDGQDGSYYSNIAGRLGFTPVRQGTGTGQTSNTVNIGWSNETRLKCTVDALNLGNFVFDSHIADVWRASNDGSGSGLDADLLDGQDGSFYANIVARLGFWPVRQGTGIDQKSNVVNIGWSDEGKLKCTVDALNLGNFAFASDIWDVWRASNDGSGSGLDADLLDGQQGNYYSDIPARLGYSPVDKGGDTMSGYLTIRHTSPTMLLRSTSNLSAMMHCASDRLYFLRGEIDAGNWTSINGTWPLSFNLTNNDANFGGDVFAVGSYYARNGSQVWDAGNDGSGSGLDADLLDGQDGSYYSNIVARLGYWPVQQGGGVGQGGSKIYIGWGDNRLRATVDVTDQGPIVTDAHLGGGSLYVNGSQMRRAGNHLWGPDNDGSGSGLDADLLDGQDGSYYSNIVARLGFWPVQQGTGLGQRPNTVKIGWSDAGLLKCTVDALDLGYFAFHSDIADVWRASNDGSGSGLDADLLDGRQGSDFALLDGTSTFGGSIRATADNALLMRGSAVNAPTVIHRTDGITYYMLVSNPGGGIQDTWNDLRPLSFNLTSGMMNAHTGQDFRGGTAVTGALTLNGAGVWSSANDGSGSGLDADLLDGQDGSYYSNITARLGFTPIQQGGGIGQGGSKIFIGWDGNRLRATVDVTDQGPILTDAQLAGGAREVNGAQMKRGGNHLWGPDNDGSGSGLDADLLDGWQLNDILPSGNLDSTGYCRLPNGLLMQWGMVYCNSDSYGSITFPVQFPEACFHIHSGVATELGNGNAQANCPLPYAVTKDGASFWNAAPAANAWWMAIGK